MRRALSASSAIWWLSGLAMGAPVAFLLGLACGMTARDSLIDETAHWRGALIEKAIEQQQRGS